MQQGLALPRPAGDVARLAVSFNLPDVAHTFREGHRIMVQIQSSWFPLTDRNPQKFMDIPKALATDFQKATQHVYFGGADGSKIKISVVQ